MKKIANIGRVLALAAAWSGIGAASWSLAVVAPAVVVSGCAASPRQQFARANGSFIAAVQEANELYRAGKIDEATYRGKVLPVIDRANTVLGDWQQALLSGQNSSLDYRAILRQVLDELVAATAKK